MSCYNKSRYNHKKSKKKQPSAIKHYTYWTINLNNGNPHYTMPYYIEICSYDEL